MKCRHCHSEHLSGFLDLGTAPPSNAYLSRQKLLEPEKWFPLRTFTCLDCWLVQTEDFAAFEELFDENYAYFSSFSSSWLRHCEAFVKSAKEQFSLDEASMVVEVAANDGYLLQYVRELGIPCYGIEPTASTAKAARARGIEIEQAFFDVALAEQLRDSEKQADLMIANNVLAHVPDIVGFAKGFATLLKPEGTACFEFPHLLNLVEKNQFDTIYHEHFSYLSLTSVTNVLRTAGLMIYDVEEIPTHGGSLRIYAQRSDTGSRPVTPELKALEAREADAGMQTPEFYSGFQAASERIKDDFLRFLLEAKAAGKTVCGYGAAAKGNTLMNFAGVKTDMVQYVVDKNPAKQGNFMPGSRIPIFDIQMLQNNRPDYVVILPWNLADEVCNELSQLLTYEPRFVVAVPSICILGS